ncbi:MAG TPA: GNAT family N-acetyltransferase [Roseiarcus sp.]|nr:GNAT family N-acetyltransferase [Roseiarcus sp.]
MRSLADIEAEWRALYKRANSFAQTFEYARAALAVAEQQGKQSFVVTVRDGDALRGVWGLTLERESLHSVLKPFSCGTNEEYSSPLLEDPALAGRVFRQAASLRGKADRLMIYNMCADTIVERAATALPFPQRADRLDGLIIRASKHATWADAEKRLSGKMRSSLRTSARRLEQLGELSIGWCDSDVDDVLAFFFRRKTEWLKEKGKRSNWVARNDVHVPEFFHELVRSTDNPVVAAVRLDGVPIAAALCLVGPRAVEYHATTFDPKYASCGPAQLLVRFLAQWALDRGLDFDFGMTVYDYKRKWTEDTRTYVTRRVMLTARGRIPQPREIERSVRVNLGKVRRRFLSSSRSSDSHRERANRAKRT